VVAFSVREARANFSSLVQRAARGEAVTVSRGGVPVVRLVPVENQQSKPPMSRADMLAVLRGGQMDADAWLDITAAAGGLVAEDRPETL
jgi:prevent-host-death family protein